MWAVANSGAKAQLNFEDTETNLQSPPKTFKCISLSKLHTSEEKPQRDTSPCYWEFAFQRNETYSEYIVHPSFLLRIRMSVGIERSSDF